MPGVRPPESGTGLLNGLYDLLRSELIGGDGENLVGVGGIDLPVAGSGFLVEGGRHGFDAPAAVDVGFELERFHDKWS